MVPLWITGDYGYTRILVNNLVGILRNRKYKERMGNRDDL